MLHFYDNFKDRKLFLPRGRDPSLPPADLHIGSQVTTTTITTTSHSSWKRDRRTSSGASLLGSSATWHTNTSTKITSSSSLFASKLEVLLFFCLQNRLYNAGHATKPLPLVTKAMPRWSKDFVTKRFHRLASQRKLFLLIYINKKKKKTLSYNYTHNELVLKMPDLCGGTGLGEITETSSMRSSDLLKQMWPVETVTRLDSCAVEC